MNPSRTNSLASRVTKLPTASSQISTSDVGSIPGPTAAAFDIQKQLRERRLQYLRAESGSGSPQNSVEPVNEIEEPEPESVDETVTIASPTPNQSSKEQDHQPELDLPTRLRNAEERRRVTTQAWVEGVRDGLTVAADPTTYAFNETDSAVWTPPPSYTSRDNLYAFVEADSAPASPIAPTTPPAFIAPTVPTPTQSLPAPTRAQSASHSVVASSVSSSRASSTATEVPNEYAMLAPKHSAHLASEISTEYAMPTLRHSEVTETPLRFRSCYSPTPTSAHQDAVDFPPESVGLVNDRRAMFQDILAEEEKIMVEQLNRRRRRAWEWHEVVHSVYRHVDDEREDAEVVEMSRESVRLQEDYASERQEVINFIQSETASYIANIMAHLAIAGMEDQEQIDLELSLTMSHIESNHQLTHQTISHVPAAAYFADPTQADHGLAVQHTRYRR